MFPKIDPTTTKAWPELSAHQKRMSKLHLRDLFKDDPYRFKNFSLKFGDILFDYSRNRIDAETMKLLVQLADECKLKSAIDAMFSGERINETEDRAVLHTALRNFSNQPVTTDGKDVMPDVLKV